MILEEETFKAFGYYTSALTHGSNKHIKAACDNCRKVRTTSKNAYCTLCPSCARTGNSNSLGYKHTEEHKAAMKGNTNALGHIYTPTEETKALMSMALKGNTNALGYKHTDETKAQIRVALAGANSPNWRGGISFEPYCTKFNNAFKDYIRTKFNNKCFLCSKTTKTNSRKLDVHHVNYNKDCGCDGDKTCQFVPLCMNCHRKTNFNRAHWEKIITDKLHNTIIGWAV